MRTGTSEEGIDVSDAPDSVTDTMDPSQMIGSLLGNIMGGGQKKKVERNDEEFE